MLGDVEVEDAPAIVSEHHEDEQDAKARGGNGEEIDGDQIRDVIGQVASGDGVQSSTTPVTLLSAPDGPAPMTLSNIEPL
jgi:hypothetical protein